MDMLKGQRARMLALPDWADVSIIRVDCVALKASLLPAPETCLAGLHTLLPELASELFQDFMSEVGHPWSCVGCML
jgi:dynein heavy chain